MTTPSARATVTSADGRTAVDAAVVDAMIEHGPDGHIDGHEQITDAALAALAPFVAAREAQAAAKALREASSWLMDLPSRRGPAVYADERMHADGQDVGIEISADHLRDRADRIERGDA